MSYGAAQALQGAVYQRLLAFGPLSALVGTAVYDAVPPGPVPALFVTLGPETVRDKSDQTGRGADHDFAITVVAHQAGFAQAKAAAAAVSDALTGAGLALSRGRLVALNFLRASAQRAGAGDTREITLIFRARIDD